jgi:hypothetical protein
MGFNDDGSSPTNPPSGSTQTYSTPVVVASTGFIIAIAVKAGRAQSGQDAAFYTIS